MCLIFCDHSNTICAIIFTKQEEAIGFHFRLSFTPVFWCVSWAGPLYVQQQHSGLDVRIHVKTRFHWQVSIHAQQKLRIKSVQWAKALASTLYTCTSSQKKFTFAISSPNKFLVVTSNPCAQRTVVPIRDEAAVTCTVITDHTYTYIPIIGSRSRARHIACLQLNMRRHWC